MEQPAARSFFDPARAEPWDVFVMYDMPGLVFGPDYQGLEFEEHSEELMTGTNALLDAGKGMVFLHHAVAGWPTWENWARTMGGRFHYRPAVLDGVEYPESGYHHDVDHTVEVVDAAHPIVAGVPESSRSPTRCTWQRFSKRRSSRSSLGARVHRGQLLVGRGSN